MWAFKVELHCSDPSSQMPLSYTLRVCFSVIVSQTALLKLGLADLTELQTSGFGEEKKPFSKN